MIYDEKHVEKIARRLCEIRGIDPDAMVPHGADPDERGIAPAVLLRSPAWTRAAREVRARVDMDLAFGVGLPPARSGMGYHEMGR